jgi:hypothetical protein
MSLYDEEYERSTNAPTLHITMEDPEPTTWDTVSVWVLVALRVVEMVAVLAIVGLLIGYYWGPK